MSLTLRYLVLKQDRIVFQLGQLVRHPQFAVQSDDLRQLALFKLNEELRWDAQLTKGDHAQELVHH